MSALAEEQDDVTPNLADLDVPMSETAPDPTADFNAAPPPLPELFDDKGKPVPYIIDLMLDKDGIKKETFDEKDDNGDKTGDKVAYFTAAVLGQVVATGDERELDLGFFNGYLRPPQRWTSFVRKGKGLSEIAHLGKVAGLDITSYDTVGAMAPDLVEALSRRGEEAIQAKAFIQWQWYSKGIKWTNGAGVEKTGKTVRYGMKNADEQNADGSYNAKIVHKETGEELVARAVITRIEPLD